MSRPTWGLPSLSVSWWDTRQWHERSPLRKLGPHSYCVPSHEHKGTRVCPMEAGEPEQRTGQAHMSSGGRTRPLGADLHLALTHASPSLWQVSCLGHCRYPLPLTEGQPPPGQTCATGSCVRPKGVPGEGRGGDRPVARKTGQRAVKATKPEMSPAVES